MEKKKAGVVWWIIALALYFGTAGSAYYVAKKTEAARVEPVAQAMKLAAGQRDNAEALAEQYKAQYQDAIFEIAELKEKNEALTARVEELQRRSEELSFALDEVCNETGWTSLGTFRITHFCACSKCCGKWAGGPTASGTMPEAGRTIAVDPDVIPLGSEVRINGHVYIAEDTGSGVDGNAIDIFVDDHAEAVQLGMYYAEVEWRAA